MDSAWDIQFTHQFERDAKRLEKSGFKNWLEDLKFLKKGPTLNNKQLKPLKSKSKAYRWRKGDLRVVFRVLGESRSVLLLGAGHRKDVYKKNISNTQSAIGYFDELIVKRETSSTNDSAEKEAKGQQQALFIADNSAEQGIVEEIFLEKADLFLISIPEQYHAALLACDSLEAMRNQGLPEGICSRIEDYLTAPGQHHVGRIYALDGNEELTSIANLPLGEFLVALDPQQINIVEKSFKGGPWLIRGGPGTGKTLINLARIKRICSEDVGKDIFQTNGLRIGFITFNRPLSQAAEDMFSAIARRRGNNVIEFHTLDAVVYALGKQIRSTRPSILKENNAISMVSQLYNEVVSDEHDESYIEDFRKRRGERYILEEFEEVILGNDLLVLEDYLAFLRKGRKSPLQPKERKLIHNMFGAWLSFLKKNNYTTFSARRLKVLKGLEKGLLNFRKYDFLFVDELQDLSVVAIRILTHLVEHIENITFSADTAQSIYLKSPSWTRVSPNLRFHTGNSFILRNSYRMTLEIEQAIRPLRINAGDAEKEDDGINNAIFSGPKPFWVDCSLQDQPKYAASLCQEIVQVQNINPSQIAIIVPDGKMLKMAMSCLESVGMPVVQVSRENRLNLTSKAVHVLTAYVAKGLEFPFVIALGVVEDKYPQYMALNKCIDDSQRDEEMEKAKRLLYVALSRSGRGLWMFTDPLLPCPFLRDLDLKYWNTQALNLSVNK